LVGDEFGQHPRAERGCWEVSLDKIVRFLTELRFGRQRPATTDRSPTADHRSSHHSDRLRPATASLVPLARPPHWEYRARNGCHDQALQGPSRYRTGHQSGEAFEARDQPKAAELQCL
jgi:hypothetical protein